jgi:hypothetical protein
MAWLSSSNAIRITTSNLTVDEMADECVAIFYGSQTQSHINPKIEMHLYASASACFVALYRAS